MLKLHMQVKPAEVDIFLKGGGALDINGVRKKPKVHPYGFEPHSNHFAVVLPFGKRLDRICKPRWCVPYYY